MSVYSTLNSTKLDSLVFTFENLRSILAGGLYFGMEAVEPYAKGGKWVKTSWRVEKNYIITCGRR